MPPNRSISIKSFGPEVRIKRWIFMVAASEYEILSWFTFAADTTVWQMRLFGRRDSAQIKWLCLRRWDVRAGSSLVQKNLKMMSCSSSVVGLRVGVASTSQQWNEMLHVLDGKAWIALLAYTRVPFWYRMFYVIVFSWVMVINVKPDVPWETGEGSGQIFVFYHDKILMSLPRERTAA